VWCSVLRDLFVGMLVRRDGGNTVETLDSTSMSDQTSRTVSNGVRSHRSFLRGASVRAEPRGTDSTLRRHLASALDVSGAHVTVGLVEVGFQRQRWGQTSSEASRAGHSWS
jgi:hypothetical protein